MTQASLIVDQRSASMVASDDDIRVWARGRRIFVSSLIGGMTAERAAVRAAIEAVGAVPVMFEEDLGAQDVSAEQAYLSGVRSSEIYVGLFGPRYGMRMADGNSATHTELLEAERDGLRLCLFVNGDTSGDMDGTQRDVINGLRNLYTTSPWHNAEDLGRRVERRLRDLASEELAPWVRVGRTIFRAKELTSDGKTITVTADILSPAVHSELVRLRDSRSTVAFAAPHDARSVQFTDLTTRTVSNARHEEKLTLAAGERSSHRMPMSVNGISADEILRRSLSDGLFGTNELGTRAGHLAQPIDPFEEIRSANLDDSILRPVARLLFTQRLLADGVASRVDAFALGPSHQGRRWLRAAWTPPQVYVNVPDPTGGSVEGVVVGL